MNKRSAGQWQALFNSHQDSGLSAAAFCRQHKLCPKYFSLRKKQLHWHPANNNQQAIPSTAWLPVRTAASASAGIEVHWHSVQLRLPTSVPSTWLAELIKGLDG